MIKRYAVLLLIAMLFASATAQTNSEKASFDLTSAQENEIVNNIKKKFQEINNSKNLSIVEKDLSDYSAEGGHLTVFYDGSQLRKIIATYYGETGKVIFEYYFWADSLIFIFRQLHKYNSSPFYEPSGDSIALGEPYDHSKTKITEDRFYFHKNRLVRWIDEARNRVDPRSDVFIKSKGNVWEM
jgi:alpha-amylase/alpha-mannosidase (GH57 family)